MKISQVIISQYLAALEMLKETVTQCPDALWDCPEDKTKSWQIAYHALFYTHFYLQDSEETFAPWSKHRKEAHDLKQSAAARDGTANPIKPYSKDEVLEYLAFCQPQVAERVPQVNLEGVSGFSWLPFSKLELQFYTIRHIQQHTGELMERLGTRAGVVIHWVGRKPS